MEQLKSLNLTEKDFKLLVDGLDALPEKGMAGEMMGELLIGILSKNEEGSDGMKKMRSDRDTQRRKLESDKELLKEDVRILQGKLLMLKRVLMENKLLGDAYEIISSGK